MTMSCCLMTHQEHKINFFKLIIMVLVFFGKLLVKTSNLIFVKIVIQLQDENAHFLCHCYEFVSFHFLITTEKIKTEKKNKKNGQNYAKHKNKRTTKQIIKT